LSKTIKEVESWQQEASFTINRKIKATYYRHKELIKSEYQLLDLDLRGKSNNRYSLNQHKVVYDDPKISLSLIDEASTFSHLVLYSDFTQYKPLMDIKINNNNKLASILTMIRLVELALYLQK